MEIWKWMQAAEREKKHRHHLHRMASNPKDSVEALGPPDPSHESEDRMREREKDEEIERLLRELEESKLRAAELKEQNRKSNLLLKQYQMGGSGGFSSPPSFSMANLSTTFARPSNLSVLCPNDVRSSTSAASMGGAQSSSPTPSPLVPPPIDVGRHNRLASIVSTLLELMPRLVPSLTAKVRV